VASSPRNPTRTGSADGVGRLGPDEDKRYLEMNSAFLATTTSPSLTVASNNGRRLKGNGKSVDSPQEETGFEISVPRCARTADSVTVV